MWSCASEFIEVFQIVLKVNVSDCIKAADGFKRVHIIKATLPGEIQFFFFFF